MQPTGDEAPAAAGTTVETVASILGADDLVAGGHDGAGVDVALIDTGIAMSGEAVVDGPDLSTTGDDPELHGLDAFGHGTHLAGIVHGVAPGARIVNVKVAEPDGSTSIGRILRAVDWVVRNRDRGGLNVRVLNLAYGAPAVGSYTRDPLAYALEQAQRRGIAVVVAAGNGGEEAPGLDSPAYDPHLIAVGADDDARTVALADDAVPAWSSRGDGGRNPDVIAPGTAVVSLGVPGGFLYEEFPGARVGEAGFRGSGTSQAAAGVSAVAALVLAARPELRPAELKAVMRATARRVPAAAEDQQGAGVPDAAAAVAAPAPQSGREPEPARPGGQWRGRFEPSVEAAVNPRGGDDWAAGRWTAGRWTAGRWTAGRWTAGRWTAGRWTAGRWTAGRWTAGRWTAGRWTAGGWTSLAGEPPAP
jgi:serine protease AprX